MKRRSTELLLQRAIYRGVQICVRPDAYGARAVSQNRTYTTPDVIVRMTDSVYIAIFIFTHGGRCQGVCLAKLR